jgi:hypothetical protein
MKGLARALLFLSAIVVLYLSLALGLPYYDRNARQKALQIVAAELPRQASMAQMQQFMDRHTTGYDFDKFNYQLGGFLPQSRVDKVLFGRKVGIYLKVDGKAQTLRSADVEIYYTFL